MSDHPSNYISVSSDEQYIKLMKDNQDKLIIVDFYADWCPPCKMIAPYFLKFAQSYPDILFLKVNVDNLRKTASSAGIRAMPSFLFTKGGKRLHFMEGADVKGIQKQIDLLTK